jgi:16S rRNA (adenine1518-N6/adenine1519-N6)-dimethyltransferase
LIAHDIVAAAELTAQDDVLEIGPGGGVLTEPLLERAAHVTAVELDEQLAEALRRRHIGNGRLTVVSGNVLDHGAGELLAAGGRRPPYVVVANLPYYITAPVMRHFLERGPRPTRLIVMVQREVAETVAGRHGLSLLAVSVQVFGEPRVLFRVPPEAFRPPPQVDSAVLRIDCFAEPRVPEGELAGFFRIVRAGFRQPRKQLRNGLAGGLWLPPGAAPELLESAGIDPSRRPGTLSIDEWLALYRHYERMRPAFAAAGQTPRAVPGARPADRRER